MINGPYKALLLPAQRPLVRSDHKRREVDTIHHIIVNKRAGGCFPGVQTGHTAMLHSAGKLSPS
jgi:hypothetical protein